MHPYIPLPVTLDTVVPAGPGLLEWHLVVTPDMDTMMLALPANSNAEFQVGDEDADDGGEETCGYDGEEILVQPDGDDWDEPEDDESEACLGHRRGPRLSPVSGRIAAREVVEEQWNGCGRTDSSLPQLG